MLFSKIKDMPRVEWIKPMAFLTSKLVPVKIIAELPNGQYVFLLPPLYQIEEAVERYVFEAAVAKYEYKLVQEESIVRNQEDLETFLKWFK